jgi:hypothetical protein
MTDPYELEWKPGHPRRGAAPVQRGQLHTLGGSRAGNATAQEQGWPKILAFLADLDQ